MARFGKKNIISDDISKYSICLLGEGGIGKTTLFNEVTNKLFGEGSTLFLELGKEQGADAIDGIIYEDVPNWKKFEEITNDIIKNRSTDYPDLKLIVLDTLDQAIATSDAESIRRWNVENMSNPKFTPVSTLNGTFGGFGAGMDYSVNLILNKIWDLKKVGVNTWILGHLKVRNVTDAVTGTEYNTLTTDLPQRVFNAFKNKMHIVAIAYVDRNVETQTTGKKNLVTKKDITINRVTNEVRRISFRDESNYIIDSKSRFADITPDIPMDADAFIKAIKDAIQASKKSPTKKEEVPVEKPTPVPVAEPEPVEEVVEPEIQEEDFINPPEEISEDEYPDNLEDVIRTEFKKCKDAALKAQIKKIISEHGGKLNVVDEDGLKKIYDLLCR